MRDSGCHLFDAKSLIFLKNSNVHSFVDGWSIYFCVVIRVFLASSIKNMISFRDIGQIRYVV
jgi:hypothetical protein